MNKLIEGKVDTSQDHFELTYGSIKDDQDFITVALLCRAGDNEFVYQFVGDKLNDEVKKNVLHELDFYIIKHGPRSIMKDAWIYAQYHAGATSNIYSDVHWDFYPANFKEHRDIAIKIAGVELLKIYPNKLKDGQELSLFYARQEGKKQSIWSVNYAVRVKGTRSFLMASGISILVDIENNKIISVEDKKESK